MELARTLHYTLTDLFARTTSEELGLWTALYLIEAEEQNNNALKAKAEAALRK